MKKSNLLALLLLSASSASFAQTVYDDFNLKQWNIIKEGTGPTIQEANQRLEITLPANSKDGSNAIFYAGYSSKCVLQGNFDIQFDYSLLKFPSYSGVRAGITIPSVITVARESFSQHDDGFTAGEFYIVGGDAFTSVPTSDKKGKLRVARNNGVVSGYFFDATLKAWQLIGSSSVSIDNVPFQIWVWSHDSRFDDKSAKVAFDNIIVNSGNLAGVQCPFTAP